MPFSLDQGAGRWSLACSNTRVNDIIFLGEVEMIKELFFNDGSADSDNYYQALRAFRIDPNQNFIDVKSRIGLGPATAYAQMYFANLKSYKRLRRELELHQRESNPANRGVDILIVLPPHGTIPRSSLTNFLRQSMGLCTSGQFALISHAQINTDRVVSGAQRLSRLILEKRKNKRKLLIVSYSFGSAFVRVMLDRLEAEDLSPIKGWFNISGLIFGSPRFHCSDRRGILNAMSTSQRSFSSQQNYFHGPLNTRGIKTVHALGIHNGTQLSFRNDRKREYLRAWGPNDGLISFASYQKLDQPVIPLFDQSHEINLAPMASTFVRTLSSMVSTVPVRDSFLPSDQGTLDFV